MRPIHNPWDSTVVGEVPVHGIDDVRDMVAGAVETFADTRRWPSHRRHNVLSRIADSLAAKSESIAESIVAESGKTIRDARTEVARAIFVFQIAAEESRRIGGELLPLDLAPGNEGRIGIVRRRPRGVVAAITPFNFPLNLVAHKVAPAIAAGCPVVLKPSERTPLTALALRHIILEAGWPEAGFPVATPMNPAETARFLAETPNCPVLSFTGSDTIGFELARLATRKQTILELGGNAGVVVCQDADLDRAAQRCVMGATANAGQVCISVQRIAVHRDRFTEFVERFLRNARSLRLGNPADPQTDVGPLIDQSAADRLEALVADALEHGATALLPLERHPHNVIGPVLLTGTAPGHPICTEEAFGPLAVVEPFDTDDQAIDWIAETRYGLQAGIFTRDLATLWKAADHWDVGAVLHDEVPTWRLDTMPYGGERDSGRGREGVRWAIESMTTPQLIALRTPYST